MKTIRLSLLIGLSMLFACKEVVPPTQIIEALPPLVNPPIPELAPPFESRTIDPEKGAILNYKTGSQVIIPPAALVDAQGNPIQGQVEIAFREYHDAASILLSGIPMSYDSADVTTHFQTAGMFELRAYASQGDSSFGEEVFLENGSLAQVNLASSEVEDNYNFYRLDEQARGWQFEGQRSPEVNVRKLEIKQKINDLAATPGEINLGRNPFAFNYDAILDVFFGENANKIYQARRTPTTTRLRVLGKAQAYGLECLDFTVYQHIEWKGQSFPASMMVWDHLNDKAFPNWAKGCRNRRLVRFDDDIYKLVLSNGEMFYFVTWVKAVMPLRQLFASPPANWAEQSEEIKQRIAAEEKRLATEAEVMRSFEVRAFGIYNWDRFLKEEDPIPVLADFDFNNESIDMLSKPTVFYLPGDNRSVVKMPQENWSRFAIVDDPQARIISILPNQRIALFSKQKYRAIDRETLRLEEQPAYTFAMQDIGKLSSQQQLMTIIGID